jgi:deoxyribose-phosphate aldolase
LETGGLGSREKITHAARLAIEAGADFLKTSTGFHDVGATLDAVEALLDVIIEFQSRPTAATASTPLKSSATITSPPPSSSPSVVGLKVSGGIKTFEQATLYYDMVEKKMGADWMSPRTFRIGASSLLNDLLRVSATRAV